MGRPLLVAFLVVSVAFGSIVTATEGRAAPQCAEFDLSAVSSSTTGISVEPNACLIVNLGTRSSESTLSVDIDVLDDSMDVLLFDQNGISVYKNGQNYRSSFVPEGSFESFIGSEWYDWKIPSSFSDKSWYLVFDNTAHDGDQGFGDQGGMTSKFLIDVDVAEEVQYSLIHDTFLLNPGERLNLVDFMVDYNTELNYWIHPIDGSGELFIQSDTQLSGDLLISGTKLDEFPNEMNYFNWNIPEYLDLKNLNLMADAESNGFHFTIMGWFDPTITPTIVDYVSGETTIGESIILDGSNSPNSLGQIASMSWDFDSDDVIDETGFVVEASWLTPGLKTINATAQSATGEVTFVSHQITVFDVSDPIAVISGMGIKGINGEWRLLRSSTLVLESSNSYDDHAISSISWDIDGTPAGTTDALPLNWGDIGTHKITLTVTDASGNTNSTVDTIFVYDSTIPRLDMSAIKEISEVYQGENTEFTATAFDLWDDESNLTFSWDLDLEKDSNGDGDTRNDDDYTGQQISLSFDKTGKYSIGLTVYDASNNTDFEVFTIQVVEPPSNANLFAIVAVVFFVVIVVTGVVLFGYRGSQRRLAIEMLMQNNFTFEQASARVKDITKTTNLSMFAKAEQLAGVVDGGQLKTPEQIEYEAKAQEIAAIYGNDTNIADPYAGFKPQFQQSASVGQFTDEALAAFTDEPVTTTKPTPKSTTGKVRSGGIALPTQMSQNNQQPVQQQNSAGHNLIGDCSSCGQKFSVTLPQGVNSAVVACPKCGSDQLFER